MDLTATGEERREGGAGEEDEGAEGGDDARPDEIGDREGEERAGRDEETKEGDAAAGIEQFPVPPQASNTLRTLLQVFHPISAILEVVLSEATSKSDECRGGTAGSEKSRTTFDPRWRTLQRLLAHLTPRQGSLSLRHAASPPRVLRSFFVPSTTASPCFSPSRHPSNPSLTPPQSPPAMLVSSSPLLERQH